jgi:integrase/recombinase XerD
MLRSLPNSNPHYFFWSGNGDPETAKRGWVRSFALLFKNAALKSPDGTPKRCHSHMFRDTSRSNYCWPEFPSTRFLFFLDAAASR